MRYKFIKFVWTLGLRVFFRRIEVRGREHIPQSAGILLVSNHVNAFVDGILLLTILDFPLRLTAKATLNKNPVFRFLLDSMSAILLRRAEDGEQPGGNAQALEEVDRSLQRGERVLLFPEGFSHSEGTLRPFKKGAARIALHAASHSKPFFVVPVGLVYLEKDRFRSEVLVEFGRPISVGELASSREPEALNKVFRERIEQLSLPLPPQQLREYSWLAKFLLASESPPPRLGEPRGSLFPLVQEIRRLRSLSSSTERSALEEIEQQARTLYQRTSRGGLRPDELFLPISSWRAGVFWVRECEIFFIAFLPALWGWLQAAPAYFLTRLLLGKSARDEDHVATHAIFLGLPIFFVFLFMQTLLIAALFGKFLGLLYLFTLPYFLMVAVLSRDRYQECLARIRSFLFLISHSDERRRLQTAAQNLRRAIRQRHESQEYER